MNSAGQSEEVSRALGLLQAGKIENMTIDVAHRLMSFEVSALWSGSVEHHSVTFEGMASFYVVFGAKDERFVPHGADRFPGDTLVGECDDAAYYPEGFGEVLIRARSGSWESNWVGDFTTRPNFLVTINDFIVLVEARLVRIDDMTFEVGYVHDAPTSEET